MSGADTSGAGRGPHTFGERWSWVQFACAFVLFGFIAFLHVDPPLDGLWAHLVMTLAIAGVSGAIAGRFGDDAWHWLVKVVRWR
ncbi:MAG TPA: hypothetical protein VIM73_15445 [Polyangiaceae bacterium]